MTDVHPVNVTPLVICNTSTSNCHIFTGFLSLLFSLAAFGVAVYMKLPLHIVHKKFQQLIVSGTIFCFVMSLFLYIKARRGPKSKLAPGGNTGRLVVTHIDTEAKTRINPVSCLPTDPNF